METNEGAHALEMALGIAADAVAGGKSVVQEPIDLGGILLGDLQSEGLAELLDDVIHTEDGIAIGNVGTLLVVAHLLAPHILHEVVGKGRAESVGRPWAPFSHVGHLLGGEIRVCRCTLCRGNYGGRHHHGEDHHFFHITKNLEFVFVFF